jgi:hypothetical protein
VSSEHALTAKEAAVPSLGNLAIRKVVSVDGANNLSIRPILNIVRKHGVLPIPEPPHNSGNAVLKTRWHEYASWLLWSEWNAIVRDGSLDVTGESAHADEDALVVQVGSQRLANGLIRHAVLKLVARRNLLGFLDEV